MHKNDFLLGETTYLLNHSVGRPLKQAEQSFAQRFFAPWQEGNSEPWGAWLTIIKQFQRALGQLFNAPNEQFCPQVNLSSALTKLVMALDQLQRDNSVVLISEIDFPSIGFVLQKALPTTSQLRFIPKEQDITDANVWANHLTPDLDMVLVSHAYSNTGQRPPLDDILSLATKRNILSVLDVAQSAGIIPLDLSQQPPDFLIGSSVKWLCGGPGAAYLWVNPQRLADCHPRDIGWFSHENPFEFDIHHFRYHDSSLRFWGGTPSIAPYAIAAHSISYFANIGCAALRQHNQALIDMVAAELDDEFVSPRQHQHRSGTLILNFAEQQQAIISALQQAGICVDQRSVGIRISPHIYNDAADIQHLLTTIKSAYRPRASHRP